MNDGKTDVKFGKVEVSVDGTAAITKTHTADLTVDGCSWEIGGFTLTNGSTVDVWYAYSVTVDVTGLTEAEKAYFTIPAGTNVECAELTARTAAATLNKLTVSFNSEGKMNGSTKTAELKITVRVAAIQKDHVTEEQAKPQLATLLAAATKA